MKDSAPYELDHLLGASPGPASVLAIMTASGSRPLPMETDLDTANPVLDTVDTALDTAETQEATDDEDEEVIE